MLKTNTYYTPDNGNYKILTQQLDEGDWMATTREFVAMGDTEAEATAKLGRIMRDAAMSIIQLSDRAK